MFDFGWPGYLRSGSIWTTFDALCVESVEVHCIQSPLFFALTHLTFNISPSDEDEEEEDEEGNEEGNDHGKAGEETKQAKGGRGEIAVSLSVVR